MKHTKIKMKLAGDNQEGYDEENDGDNIKMMTMNDTTKIMMKDDDENEEDDNNEEDDKS